MSRHTINKGYIFPTIGASALQERMFRLATGRSYIGVPTVNYLILIVPGMFWDITCTFQLNSQRVALSDFLDRPWTYTRVS